MFGFFRNKEDRSKEEEEARLRAAQRYGGWVNQSTTVPTRASQVPTSAYAAMALARHHSTHRPDASQQSSRATGGATGVTPVTSSSSINNITSNSNPSLARTNTSTSATSSSAGTGSGGRTSFNSGDPSRTSISSTYVPRSALLAPSAIAASTEFDKETKRKLLQLHQWLHDVKVMQHHLKTYASAFMDLTGAGLAVYRVGANLSSVLQTSSILSPPREHIAGFLYGGPTNMPAQPAAAAEEQEQPPLLSAFEAFQRDLNTAVKTAFAPFLAQSSGGFGGGMTMGMGSGITGESDRLPSLELDADMGLSLASASASRYSSNTLSMGGRDLSSGTSVVGHHPIAGFAVADLRAGEKSQITEAAIKNIAHAEFPSAASARALAIYLDEWIDDLTACQSRLLALQQAQSDLEGPMEVLNNLLVLKAEADAASNVIRKLAMSPRQGRPMQLGGSSNSISRAPAGSSIGMSHNSHAMGHEGESETSSGSNMSNMSLRTPDSLSIAQLQSDEEDNESEDKDDERNEDESDSADENENRNQKVITATPATPSSASGTSQVYIPPSLREAAESIEKEARTPLGSGTSTPIASSTPTFISHRAMGKSKGHGGVDKKPKSTVSSISVLSEPDVVNEEEEEDDDEDDNQDQDQDQEEQNQDQEHQEKRGKTDSDLAHDLVLTRSEPCTSTSPSTSASGDVVANRAKTASVAKTIPSSVSEKASRGKKKLLRVNTGSGTRISAIESDSQDGECEASLAIAGGVSPGYSNRPRPPSSKYPGAPPRSSRAVKTAVIANDENYDEETSLPPSLPMVETTISASKSSLSTAGSGAISSSAQSTQSSNAVYAPSTSFGGSNFSSTLSAAGEEVEIEECWSVEQELALRNAKTVISVKTQALSAAEARAEEAWARTEDNLSRSDEAFGLLGATVTSLFAHLLGDAKSARLAADSWTAAHKSYSNQRSKLKLMRARNNANTAMGGVGFGIGGLGMSGIWLGPGGNSSSNAGNDGENSMSIGRQRSGSFLSPPTPPFGARSTGMSLMRQGSVTTPIRGGTDINGVSGVSGGNNTSSRTAYTPTSTKNGKNNSVSGDGPVSFGVGWQRTLLGNLSSGGVLSPDQDENANARLAALVEDDGEGGSPLQKAMRALEKEIRAKNEFRAELRRMKRETLRAQGVLPEDWSTDDEASFTEGEGDDSDYTSDFTDSDEGGFHEDDSVDEWSIYDSDDADSDNEAAKARKLRKARQARRKRQQAKARLDTFTDSEDSDSDEFITTGTESESGAVDGESDRPAGDIWDAVEKKLRRKREKKRDRAMAKEDDDEVDENGMRKSKTQKKKSRRRRRDGKSEEDEQKSEMDGTKAENVEKVETGEEKSEDILSPEDQQQQQEVDGAVDLPPVCPDLFDEGLPVEIRYINGIPPCPDLFDEFSGTVGSSSGPAPANGTVQGYVLGPDGIPYCPDLFNEFGLGSTGKSDETAGMTPAQKRAHLAAQKEREMWIKQRLPPALPYAATRPLRHLHWSVIAAEDAMIPPTPISIDDLAAMNDLSRTVRLARASEAKGMSSPMGSPVKSKAKARYTPASGDGNQDKEKETDLHSGVFSTAATDSAQLSLWRHIADREILLRRKYKMELDAHDALPSVSSSSSATPSSPASPTSTSISNTSPSTMSTSEKKDTILSESESTPSLSINIGETPRSTPMTIPREQIIGEELFPDEPSASDPYALAEELGVMCSCPTAGTIEHITLPDGEEVTRLHACDESMARHLALLPPLDPISFESLFATDVKGKGGKAEGGLDSTKSTAPALIELIDRKRAYNISIALRGFKPLSPLEVVEAVGSMHEECLSADKLARLASLLPTQAELAILAAYRGPPSMLAEPEQLLYSISKAPFFREHLRTMIFALELPELSSMVRAQMSTLRGASMQVVRSPSLRGIIQLVLRAGNFLNQTTKKGRAFAFSLPILSRLRSTKTGDLKGNLLTVLADHVELNCPSLLSLPEELAMCSSASRIDAAFVKNEVANFQLNLIVVQQLVASYASNAPEEMQVEMRKQLLSRGGSMNQRVTMERDATGAISAMASPTATGSSAEEREMMERLAIAGGAPPKLARFATKSTDEVQDISECWELTVRVVENCASYLREPDFANDWPALFAVFAALCTDFEQAWAENAARRERDSRMRARESGIRKVFQKGTSGDATAVSSTGDSQSVKTPQAATKNMNAEANARAKAKAMAKARKAGFENENGDFKMNSDANDSLSSPLKFLAGELDMDGAYGGYTDDEEGDADEPTVGTKSPRGNQHLVTPELDTKLTQLARHHSRHVSQVQLDRLDDSEWES